MGFQFVLTFSMFSKISWVD